MPKWTKWLLVGCGGVLVLAVVGFAIFAGWVSNQPRQWRAQASLEIAAPPAAVLAEFEDLTRWPTWSAWARDNDTGYERTYSGAPSGVGAVMSWHEKGGASHVRVGTLRSRKVPGGTSIGNVRITAVRGEAGLDLETTNVDGLVVERRVRDGESSTSSRLGLNVTDRDFVVPGHVTLEPTPSGTRVTWVEEGDLGDGFVAGLLALAMRGHLEEAHVEVLDLSLRGLERKLETPR